MRWGRNISSLSFHLIIILIHVSDFMLQIAMQMVIRTWRSVRVDLVHLAALLVCLNYTDLLKLEIS